MNQPKVAIVLINYKTYADRFLTRAYESLLLIDYPKDRYRIYIADNATTPETQSKLVEIAPEAVIIPSSGNGWGHGNNICVKKATEEGFDDYFCFVNMDTIFHKDFLVEMIRLIEGDKTIGGVQSKLLLHPPDSTGRYKINSIGNALTFLGFGFCGKDGVFDDSISVDDGDIVSASGASFLIPRKIFFAIGACDESYFMYHDDIELSQKIRMIGYRLCLASRSIVFHQHEFARSIRQMYCMERNRIRFMLEFYRLRTLFLIAPAFIVMEIGMVFYAIKNRMLLTKLRSYCYFLNSSVWFALIKKRAFIQKLRTISDKEFFIGVSAKIEYQSVDNILLRIVANPLFDLYWRIIKFFIVW